MHIKVMSTRHTAIGTLRRGIVYDLDENNRKVKKAIDPLLKGKDAALKKLTKKQAAAAAADVESLVVADIVEDDVAPSKALEQTFEDLKQAASDAMENKEKAQNDLKELQKLSDAQAEDIAALKEQLEAANKNGGDK